MAKPELAGSGYSSGGSADYLPDHGAGGAGGYVTRDSGERQHYSTGMQRDVNTGKPRFDLIMPKEVPYREQLLTRWAMLMERGAKKYTSRNWEQAATQEELDRFLESAFRHFIQYLSGEDDEDHVVACLFNLQGAELVKWKLRSQDQSP